MSPQGRKVLELGTPLVPPCIFLCSPPPPSSPFTVIGAGLRSSLTHLRSSLASHRPPLRWFAAVLANPLFPGASRPGSGSYPPSPAQSTHDTVNTRPSKSFLYFF